MASLVQELIQILEEETGCYELLLSMADNKKDVIINGDLPSLQELTKQEQEMAGQLLRLEKKRSKIIDDISMVTNQDSKTMTVSTLIKMLEGQAEQKPLIESSNKLIDVVRPLQEANNRNEELLKQSIEFVDFTMNAIQSARQPVATNNYQPNNGYGGSYGGRSLFDSKQ